MARNVVITLRLDEWGIEEFKELDFGKLRLNLEILAQQPPVEVLPCYQGKEIDYEGSYRHINVVTREDDVNPLHLEYQVVDHASVRGNVHHSNQVGRRTYTQEEWMN